MCESSDLHNRVAARRYLSTGVFSEEAAAGDPGPCSVAEFPSATARLPFFKAPHLLLIRASDDPDTGEELCCWWGVWERGIC